MITSDVSLTQSNLPTFLQLGSVTSGKAKAKIKIKGASF